MTNRPLIINDPVYGFTEIPRGLLTWIIEHPYLQRLGRIRQLGMSALVYPGAQHTRQQHSIGAFHLTQEALRVLREKGHFLFDSEIEAVEAAILMHDIGHGPFSHVLEKTLMPGVSHEDLSLLMMERMNREKHGELSLAISIFRKKHHKPFLHELISSQLDMDRLDYLCRDSFFSGIRDGNIGAERIIRMLNLWNDRLVVDAKGLYSVENYLISRRMMYWQVYLHKTVVAADEVLRQALRRAKFLTERGVHLFASSPLTYFLRLPADFSLEHFTTEVQTDRFLDIYAQLEDNDILSALKEWRKSDDKILSLLSDKFINRHLFKVDVREENVQQEEVDVFKEEIARALNIPIEDTDYFLQTKVVEKEMYSTSSDGIKLLYSDGEVKDVSEVSNIVRSEQTSLKDQKTYLIYHRV